MVHLESIDCPKAPIYRVSYIVTHGKKVPLTKYHHHGFSVAFGEMGERIPQPDGIHIVASWLNYGSSLQINHERNIS